MTRRFQAFAIGLAVLIASLAVADSKSPLADATEKSDRAAIRTLLKQRADVTRDRLTA